MHTNDVFGLKILMTVSTSVIMSIHEKTQEAEYEIN